MTIDALARRDRGLLLIAAFKLLKALLLVLAGVGLLSLLRPDVGDDARAWLVQFTGGRGLLVIQTILSFLSGATPRRIEEFGLAAICYGLLFATEGVGLWLGKRWAEYITVVTTSLLVPFEVYELARRVTVVRAGTMVVNVALVAYLVYRLRHPIVSRPLR